MAPPDSVRLDGITYQRGAYGQEGKIPAASVDRGAPLGTVESEVARYELRDGQATELRAGTRLYAARGKIERVAIEAFAIWAPLVVVPS